MEVPSACLIVRKVKLLEAQQDWKLSNFLIARQIVEIIWFKVSFELSPYVAFREKQLQKWLRWNPFLACMRITLPRVLLWGLQLKHSINLDNSTSYHSRALLSPLFTLKWLPEPDRWWALTGARCPTGCAAGGEESEAGSQAPALQLWNIHCDKVWLGWEWIKMYESSHGPLTESQAAFIKGTNAANLPQSE